MAWFYRLIGGWRALVGRRRIEHDLDEELRDYLEHAVERKVAGGWNRAEALRAARIEIGGFDAVKERVRDIGWESIVDSVWQDLRYAIRGLRAAPLFSSIAILTLALGIGANTAIFSVVNGLLLRSLPVAEPQRLVSLTSTDAAVPGVAAPWTYPIWQEINRRADLFGGVLAWAQTEFRLADRGEKIALQGMYVSGDYFAVLGVRPLLGRMIVASDDRQGMGDATVAVISYGYWQRHFGGSPDAVGSSLLINGVSFTVVGVTPSEFFGTEVGWTFDVAAPFAAEPLVRGKDSLLGGRRSYWVSVMMRLRGDQSLDRATAAIRSVQPQIRDAAEAPQSSARARGQFLAAPLVLEPAETGTSWSRQQYRQPLLTVLVVVALVLLIACANIANLLLARAAARRHELSVRRALGAGRGRLARQLLIESLLLAATGAVVGLVLAAWSIRALVAQLWTSGRPAYIDASIDWRVLSFTALVAIGTAILFGLAPALRAGRAAPIDALKEHSHSSTRSPLPLSACLVIGQLAVSLVLVVAAGLLLRTFGHLAALPLGFDADRVLVVNVNAARAATSSGTRLTLYQRLVESLASVPGVAKAAASTVTPISGRGWRFQADVAGGAVDVGADRFIWGHQITPGWLATYGTPILAGRDIEALDTRQTQPVALVNEAFVRRFLPGQSAVGRTLVELAPGGRRAERTIVGIVGDAVYRSLRDPVRPTAYVPLAQADLPPNDSFISISVRSADVSPSGLERSVAERLSSIDRDLVLTFRPLEEQVNASLNQERLLATLSAFFGALALALAGLGLYGLTAYAVARRRGEIGVRVALGATRSDVMRLVVGRSLRITSIGLILGLSVAVAVTRYLNGMLFGLTPHDPPTFLGVAALFAVVATAAACVPAFRATNVDPVIALRAE